MRLKPGGRVASLLAWGLLVGGVALVVTFPGGRDPGDPVGSHLPGALLFLLAGLVFGLTHPHGRAWAGAGLLGWVPATAGLFLLVGGRAGSPAGGLLLLAVGPAVLALVGAATGAAISRRGGRPRAP